MAPVGRDIVMNIERFRKIRSLFDAALERDPQSRRAFLDQSCGEDAQLLVEVEELLADAKEPTARPHDSVPQPPHLVGRWIGNYEIVSQLGEGGMGIVYLAEQRPPLRRRVALKLMKRPQ